MRKAIVLALLSCFALGLPFLSLAPIAGDKGEVLMALDVCSFNAPSATDAGAAGIAEAGFGIASYEPVSFLREMPAPAHTTSLSSSLEKPPRY